MDEIIINQPLNGIHFAPLDELPGHQVGLRDGRRPWQRLQA
jgi:hypothetical protein